MPTRFFQLLLLFLLTVSNAMAGINQVEESLNHANTYYWLSRARQNNEVDIKRSLHYLELAEKQLEELKGDISKEDRGKFRHQIKEGKIQRAQQLLIAKERSRYFL